MCTQDTNLGENNTGNNIFHDYYCPIVGGFNFVYVVHDQMTYHDLSSKVSLTKPLCLVRYDTQPLIFCCNSDGRMQITTH